MYVSYAPSDEASFAVAEYIRVAILQQFGMPCVMFQPEEGVLNHIDYAERLQVCSLPCCIACAERLQVCSLPCRRGSRTPPVASQPNQHVETLAVGSMCSETRWGPLCSISTEFYRAVWRIGCAEHLQVCSFSSRIGCAEHSRCVLCLAAFAAPRTSGRVPFPAALAAPSASFRCTAFFSKAAQPRVQDCTHCLVCMSEAYMAALEAQSGRPFQEFRAAAAALPTQRILNIYRETTPLPAPLRVQQLPMMEMRKVFMANPLVRSTAIATGRLRPRSGPQFLWLSFGRQVSGSILHCVALIEVCDPADLITTS